MLSLACRGVLPVRRGALVALVRKPTMESVAAAARLFGPELVAIAQTARGDGLGPDPVTTALEVFHLNPLEMAAVLSTCCEVAGRDPASRIALLADDRELRDEMARALISLTDFEGVREVLGLDGADQALSAEGPAETLQGDGLDEGLAVWNLARVLGCPANELADWPFDLLHAVSKALKGPVSQSGVAATEAALAVMGLTIHKVRPSETEH